MNGFTETIGGLTALTNSNIASGNLRIGSAGLTLANGTVGASTTLSISNTFTLSGDITSSGDAGDFITGGKLVLNGSHNFNVADGASATDLSISNAIADGTTLGGITKTGSGTLVLSGNNTFTGGLTVNGGTLTTINAISSTNSLAASNLNTGATGTDVVLNLPTTVPTTVKSISGSVAVPLSGTNTATIDNGGQLLTDNQSAATTFAGTIADSGGLSLSSALASNSLTLSGTNTYTGSTTLGLAATLIVNGSTAPASAVSVGAGATLGGTGTIGGSVTVNGTLKPATATTAGTLTVGAAGVGDVTFATGSNFDVNYLSTGTDELIVNGTATLTNATLNVSSAANAPFGVATTILHAGNLASTFFSGMPDGTMFVTSAGQTFTINYDYVAGNVTLTRFQAPFFLSGPQAGFNVGTADSFTVTAPGYPVPTLSEVPSDAPLPASLSFSPSTGVISGTPGPGDIGTYTLHFIAHSTFGSDATQTFILSVGLTPTFTSATMTTQLTGIGGSFTATASGSAAITLSADPATLPPGMTFSAGVLSGAPTSLGVFDVHLTATNAIGSTTQTLIVTVDPALIVTSTFDSAVYAVDAHTGALVQTLIASNTSPDLFGPAGATLGPDGDLYVSSQGAVEPVDGQPLLFGDKILQINLSTGQVSTFLDASELDQVAGIPSGGHFFPAGLAFGPDGDLYVAQNGGQASSTGEVVRFDVTDTAGVLSVDPTPADAVVVGSGFVQPTGLAFGVNVGDTNDLYVANSLANLETGNGEVDKINNATGTSRTTSTFVAGLAGVGTPQVVPGQSGPVTQTYSGLLCPAGLAFGPDGELYVSDLGALSNNGNVLKINSDGSVASAVFTQMNASDQGTLELQFPSGLQFDDQGNLLTADLGESQSTPYAGGVNEYPSSGTFSQPLVSSVPSASFPGGIAPSSLVLDMPRQSTVYVASDGFGVSGTPHLRRADSRQPRDRRRAGRLRRERLLDDHVRARCGGDDRQRAREPPAPMRGVADADRHRDAAVARQRHRQLDDLVRGSATVDLQGNTLTIGDAVDAGSLAGLIKGTGGLVKVGSDTLTLGGTDTYSGPTAISAGSVVVSGSSAVRLLSVSAGTLTVNGSLSVSSTVSLSGTAVLGGTGTVGNVTNSGIVNPGSTGAPGILNIAGNLTLGPGTLVLDLAAAGSDSIKVPNVASNINIMGTTLSLNVSTITPGESFTILSLASGDSVSGFFNGLNGDNSTMTVGSLTFTIHYNVTGSGDGTDDVAYRQRRRSDPRERQPYAQRQRRRLGQHHHQRSHHQHLRPRLHPERGRQQAALDGRERRLQLRPGRVAEHRQLLADRLQRHHNRSKRGRHSQQRQHGLDGDLHRHRRQHRDAFDRRRRVPAHPQRRARADEQHL